MWFGYVVLTLIRWFGGVLLLLLDCCVMLLGYVVDCFMNFVLLLSWMLIGFGFGFVLRFDGCSIYVLFVLFKGDLLLDCCWCCVYWCLLWVCALECFRLYVDLLVWVLIACLFVACLLRCVNLGWLLVGLFGCLSYVLAWLFVLCFSMGLSVTSLIARLLSGV